MTLESFFQGLWTDINNAATWVNAHAPTPSNIADGISSTLSWTGQTIGNTVQATLSPLLIPILLIVFAFALGGGRIA